MAKKVAFDMGVLKKHLFWICTPLGLVVAVLAGIMAIGSIADDLDKQKKQLDGQKETMGRLRGEAPNHPNQGTIDAVEEERKKLERNVFTAWQVLEKDQKDGNRWTGLATRATQEIERKKFLDPLEGATLDNYLAFAKAEINKLVDNSNIRRVKLYNAQWQSLEPDELVDTTGSGGGRFGGGRSMGDMSRGQSNTSSSQSSVVPAGAVYWGGLVVWDQPTLDITMTNWQQRPFPFEVWLTQEDIWVYQALLWVVRESNKDAEPGRFRVNTTGTAGRMNPATMNSAMMNVSTRPLNLENSVVKQIIDIAIGQQAAQQLYTQSSRRISSGLGSMGMDGDLGSSGGFGSGFGGGGFGRGGFGSGMGDSGGFGGGGFMDSAAAAEALRSQALGGRYVDATGAPLMEAEEALAGQFRRMPVYLNILADQRYISDILVSCANCPMPIDLLWVTINPDATHDIAFASSTSSTGMGGDSGGFGRSSMSSGRSSRGGDGMGRSSGRSYGGSGTTNVDFGPHAVQIEIYGCINIFSPPDLKKITEGTN